MAYFYIDSTLGTRITGGGYATQQSGSFVGLGAANIYASQAAAQADGATAAGSIVLWSTDHSENPSDLNLNGPTVGDPVTIISVDAANCDIELMAASTQATASDDIITAGKLVLRSLRIGALDDYSPLGITDLRMIGGIFASTTTEADSVKILTDGHIYTFIGVTITGSFTIYIGNGSVFKMFGGSAIDSSLNLIQGVFTNGGGTLHFNGTNLSGVTGYLLAVAGSDLAVDDTINISFENCQLNPSVSFSQEILSGAKHTLDITGCASSSALAEYQFHHQRYGGYMDDQSDTGIHRDESTAFPSGTKVSAHCITNSDPTVASPFSVEFTTRFSEISGTTKNIRVYLASTETLTDSDVWFDMLYVDGTNKHQTNSVSTINDNPMLSTGTALTTDVSSTWKDGALDLVGYNEYYIDIDTSVDVGSDCVPSLILNVATPSIVVYFDTSVDVVT